jgi:hypothetical protein
MGLIRSRAAILANPQHAFAKMKEQSLESVVADYLYMLLLLALATMAVDFAYFAGRSAYLDIFSNAGVNYIRMLNYGIGQSWGLAFFYVVAGTVLATTLAFVLSVIMRTRFKDMVRIMAFALSPLLLFSWLPFTVIPLFIWALFLFIIAYRETKGNSGQHALHEHNALQRD